MIGLLGIGLLGSIQTNEARSQRGSRTGTPARDAIGWLDLGHRTPGGSAVSRAASSKSQPSRPSHRNQHSPTGTLQHRTPATGRNLCLDHNRVLQVSVPYFVVHGPRCGALRAGCHVSWLERSGQDSRELPWLIPRKVGRTVCTDSLPDQSLLCTVSVYKPKLSSAVVVRDCGAVGRPRWRGAVGSELFLFGAVSVHNPYTA